MELKWGIGRLRLLVGPELRAKFDRQRVRFDTAVKFGTLDEVAAESARMVTAWRVLDEAAMLTHDAARLSQFNTMVECPCPGGAMAVVIPDGTEVHPGYGAGRGVTVYTASEIGRLLAGYPELAKIKHSFPGAEVTYAGPVRDPLEGFESSPKGLSAIIDDVELGI
jgi:hypothetical protein